MVVRDEDARRTNVRVETSFPTREDDCVSATVGYLIVLQSEHFPVTGSFIEALPTRCASDDIFIIFFANP